MVNQSRINSMETRQIELSLDTAKRLYEQGGEYRDIALTAFKEHELIGDRLPKTWDEYCAKHGEVGDKIKASLNTAYMTINRYVFSDCKQAQAHIAKMKLHLLRDDYRMGWVPEWGNIDESKFSIEMVENEFTVENYGITRHFLAFQDEKRANEFKDCFIGLIRKAGDLI